MVCSIYHAVQYIQYIQQLSFMVHPYWHTLTLCISAVIPWPRVEYKITHIYYYAVTDHFKFSVRN